MPTRRQRIKSIQKNESKRTGKKVSYQQAQKKYAKTKKFIEKELQSKKKDRKSNMRKKYLRKNRDDLLKGKLSPKQRRHKLGMINDLAELSMEEIDDAIEDSPGLKRFVVWLRENGILEESIEDEE